MDYRSCLITGASSGIGRALALRFARGGAEVALAARRVDDLEEVASEIRGQGGRARVVPMDVARGDESVAAIRAADDEMGGLDLVVACAGISKIRWTGKLGPEDVDATVAVNVSGAARTLLAVVDRMLDRRRGHLVGISSLASHGSTPKFALYSASKAFLSTFLEGLRVDLVGTGVSVTDVRPGFVRTPMNEGSRTPPFTLELDAAADGIERGIRAGRRVVELPWQQAAVARGRALLPPLLYDKVMARPRK